MIPPPAGTTGRSRRRPRSFRIPLLLALVATLWSLDLASAAPAAADGAGPTNFESVIDAVEPEHGSVRIDVVGADSFLRVRADPGVEVEIRGYDGEPYLRIDPDGTVHRNERSPATYLNASRDGSVAELPSDVGSDGNPRWARVGDGAEVAWHDHRIHWMAPTAPDVGRDGVAQHWSVPIVVDGSEVEVSGRLLHRGDQFPWPLAAALVAAAGAVVAGRRDRLRAPVLGAAALVALALATAARAVNPPGSDPSWVPLILPAAALALVAATPLTPASLRQLALPLASVAALAGWVISRIGVMWMPFVPTTAAPWMDRLGTAVVLGIAAGIAIAILLRPFADDAGQRSSGRSPSFQSPMPPRS